MKEMLSNAFDTKQAILTFLVNIKKSLKKKKDDLWPYSNQNILSKDGTIEPTRSSEPNGNL